MDKLQICKQTRKFAAGSLYTVLKKLLESNVPISEVMLRDAWLEELRKNKTIFPNGWYDPPPHGMGINFGDRNNLERINFPTLRKKDYWPRNDIFFNPQDGLLFCYASPVDKETFTIGDFGLTLYFGQDDRIKNQMINTYNALKQIFNSIDLGITLKDVYELTNKVLLEKQLRNAAWISSSDPTGINIGHTIPLFDKISVLKDWNSIINLINKKRRFINSIEQSIVKKSMGFTIEPRVETINHPQLPRSYFHTIALFHENGEKELLTNFDDLFTLAGMDYMI